MNKINNEEIPKFVTWHIEKGETYKEFRERYDMLREKFYPENKIKIKVMDVQSDSTKKWITIGIKCNCDIICDGGLHSEYYLRYCHNHWEKEEQTLHSEYWEKVHDIQECSELEKLYQNYKPYPENVCPNGLIFGNHSAENEECRMCYISVPRAWRTCMDVRRNRLKECK